MDINRATLDAVFTSVNTRFQAGLGRPGNAFASFAMEVPSSTAIETYAWLWFLSRMRQWIGPRVIQNVEAEKMNVTNLDYEHTIGVARNDIEDDNIGIYMPLAEQMGADAAYLWRRLAIEALVANGAWLDGSAFFGTTRTYGANTISNYTTSALTASTYETGKLAMESYLRHDNSPAAVVPTLLVVGPKLRSTAWHIVKDEWVAVGSTNTTTATKNPNYGATELEVWPELVGTYDDYWFLFDTRGVVKPIAVQKRKAGALVRWDQDHDECVKSHNRCDYGVHYRGAACLTLPHLAYAGIVA